ncbi:Vps51/Vps67-domain-containing protein [Diplogelasinospora grovesii]|uniref:Vacuolar protein sorting-associated protein 51 homolog n=1 Tax=Diplogelasinospora grovesii TaxID=303347 RepID=A0AAN6S686_9PEZI|nr:Vps51/Vps67-domain-containing protein [Diplogelasinospora grovesii]
MSTIASPRDPSITPLGARRINSSSQAAPPNHTTTTPTSSSRPSLDLPRSTSGSPNPNAAVSSSKRANRAALREYYNLKKQQTAGAGTPTLEVTDPLGDINDALSAAIVAQQQNQHNNAHSDIPPSEVDSPSFDADAYVSRVLKEQGLAELLRTYTRILGEMRALDAEKKALVYDNYSKLISATETIRKMRATMDPLNPMASTLDLVIAKIYEQASGIREEIRAKVPPPPQLRENAGQEEERRRRTKELAQQVIQVPEELRRLMKEGKEEEARKRWEMPRRLLERWKERRLGGDEVSRLIEEGDGIVRSNQSNTTTAGAAS